VTNGSGESLIEAALEGHRVRNVALVARLRELQVALDQPRAIDLHFFAPNPPAAVAIAAALEAIGLHGPEVGAAHADGKVSVEVTVQRPVNLVVTRSFIEPLVRIAAASGGEHDGWGTSVENGTKSVNGRAHR